MNHNDRPLLERLEALAAFLPLFEQPDFKFGEWYGPPRKDPGVIMMGGYLPSDTALSFIQMAYETGWILRDFDWPSWAGSDEAIRLRDDPATQAAATPDQLAQLLTVLIRQDRFVEGALGVLMNPVCWLPSCVAPPFWPICREDNPRDGCAGGA